MQSNNNMGPSSVTRVVCSLVPKHAGTIEIQLVLGLMLPGPEQ